MTILMNSDGQICRFDSNGLGLAYRRHGKPGATPVVLLHGILYFSYDWIPIATELGREREVVSLDMRGFGDSDWSDDGRYEVEDFAGDVVRLLDHLGWDECILVGHSMGGRVAAAVALNHPERVAASVLVDSPPENSSTGARRIGDQLAGTPDVFATMDDVLKFFPQTPWKDMFDQTRRLRFEAYTRAVQGGLAIKRDPYFTRQFFRIKLSWPYHSYEPGTWPIFGGFDMWKALENISRPTIVQVGRTGDVFSPESEKRVIGIGETVNRNITCVRHLCHHNIPGQAPEFVLQDIARIAGEIEGA